MSAGSPAKGSDSWRSWSCISSAPWADCHPKHGGQLCVLAPVCAGAIEGHAVTSTVCKFGCCQQQRGRDTWAVCDGSSGTPDPASCVTAPAPLQPQAQPAVKKINECASKVYPPCLFLCVFQSVCISSGTEVPCQLSNIAEVCVCWWSMAAITI